MVVYLGMIMLAGIVASPIAKRTTKALQGVAHSTLDGARRRTDHLGDFVEGEPLTTILLITDVTERKRLALVRANEPYGLVVERIGQVAPVMRRGGIILQQMPGEPIDPDDWNRLHFLVATLSTTDFAGDAGVDLLARLAAGERPSLGETVAVIGGGNTAMDVCRSALM